MLAREFSISVSTRYWLINNLRQMHIIVEFQAWKVIGTLFNLGHKMIHIIVQGTKRHTFSEIMFTVLLTNTL